MRQLTRAIFLPLLAALFATNTAYATTLLFDQTRSSAPGAPVIPTVSGFGVPDDYGDRVTGASMAVPGGFFTYGESGEGFTPNVEVDIVSPQSTMPPGPGTSLWQTQFGDLENVVFGSNQSIILEVGLTADPGFEVVLYGFDLAGRPDTDWTIAAIFVFYGPSIIFSEFDVLVEGDFAGPRHTAFEFMAPLTAPELFLVIDFNNLAVEDRDNIGIDNIRFGQNPRPVPEPGTSALLGLGLGLLGAKRGRGKAIRRSSEVARARAGIRDRYES